MHGPPYPLDRIMAVDCRRAGGKWSRRTTATASTSSTTNTHSAAAAAATTHAPITTPAYSLLRSKNTAWGFGLVISMTASFLVGYTMGQQQPQPPSHDPPLVLPNGLPRTCCNENDSSSSSRNSSSNSSGNSGNIGNSGNSKLTNPETRHDNHSDDENEDEDEDDIAAKLALFQERQAFLIRLRRIVGKHNVLVANDDHDNKNHVKTARFLTGARIVHNVPTSKQQQQNHTVVIVTPEHLHHVINLVEAALQLHASSPTLRCTMLPQGQNTGLTGGSTPRYHPRHDDDPQYHHITLLISFRHLNAILPLDDGARVCCMAGVGLASVRRSLWRVVSRLCDVGYYEYSHANQPLMHSSLSHSTVF